MNLPPYHHKRLILIISMILTFSLLISAFQSSPARESAVAGEIIYVDDTATGANDGSSWADAYTDLQDALAAATSGDQIWVAAGLYLPGTQVDDTFQLKSGVELSGSFPDGGGQVSERSFDHPSVLSGDLAGDDTTDATGVVRDPNNIAGQNAYHVVTGSGVDSSAVLNGFLITAGQANSTWPANSGAGMISFDGSPHLQSIEFIGNSAVAGGGGMRNDSSDPTLVGVSFYNNYASNSGGGMLNSASSPTLINVAFTNNHSANVAGGMDNIGSDPLLINVLFTANTAIDGGGINNNNSDPRLVNVTFAGNHADASGGGILSSNDSHPDIENSILWGNSPDQIIEADTSSATIQDSLVQAGCPATATCTGELLTGDPLFVRDPDPGADGVWGTSDDDYGDLQLKIDSPAINAGNNAHLPADSWDLDGDGNMGETIPYDIALNPRITDTTVDMGAYEAQLNVEITQYIYVDDTATGANNGSSWADAYTDLQDALNKATPGTQIRVAAGLYLPGTQIVDTFQLKSGVELVGSFPDGGGEVSERSIDHPSVLSGDLEGDDTTNADGVVTDTVNIAGQNAYHVVTGSGVNKSAILDLFIITAGQASGSWPEDSGAGMISFGGSPYLQNIQFIGNTAGGGGGGMRNEVGSNSTLLNVTFHGNYANYDGGGMLNASASNPTLINVNFTNNRAGVLGGGMQNINSDPLLTNVLFSANSAAYGGGMRNNSSDPRLVNVTFAGNHADEFGGGMLNFNDSHPSIDNSILWGNGPEQVFHEDTSGATIRDSLVQGGCPTAATCSGVLLTSNPLFVSNPGPGADSVWGTSDDDDGDLQLKVNSPAINAGNNAHLPADSWDLNDDGDTSETIPYDFAYNPRVYAGVVDMGAYEAQQFVITQIIYVDDTATGANDGSSWTDAFKDLQDALNKATPGTQIQVAAGLYLPGTQVDDTFQLKGGVELLGNFPDGGGETSERSFDHPSVLSGDIGEDDTTDATGVVTDTVNITGENAYHVVTGSGVDKSATLDGFTITAGKAHSTWPADSGAGMISFGGSPYLRNIQFIGNSAIAGGGGIRLEAGSNPILVDVSFYSNSAGNVGGGIRSAKSSPTLINVVFTNNHSGIWAGGLYNENSDSLLTNVLFSANTAKWGGGMVNDDSDPRLVNVTFAGNRATESGGGIHNHNDSHPTVENSILWGNSPEQVIQEDTSSATIRDSLVQAGCPTAATCSGGLLTGNPLFVSNPGPGTDGVWGTSDDDGGDLQLKVGSPAINAGNNALLPADSWDLDGDGDTIETIPYDFAYNPRITDMTVDMGAMEATETMFKVYLPLTER